MVGIVIGLVIVGFIVLGGGHTFNGIGDDIGKLTKRDQREQPQATPVYDDTQPSAGTLRPMEQRY